MSAVSSQALAFKGIKQYISRLKENLRKYRRHSNFWVNLYGSLWVEAYSMCHEWVKQLMILILNPITKVCIR